MLTPWIITPEGVKLTQQGIQPEDFIGYVSMMLNDEDPRSVREQLDANYQHGGGWQPLAGATLGEKMRMVYPGDPPLEPLDYTVVREEMCICYACAFFGIVQRGGEAAEFARMD